MKFKFTFFLLWLMSFTSTITAQKSKINWITFEQLEDSLKVKPKKVFISFYADWCAYCKKMDEAAFKNDDVIKILNKNYYAIKFDAETTDTITFEGRNFSNKNIGKSRKPTHEIPLLLASRKNIPFSLPATIILDKNFKISKRDFEYLSPKKILAFLKD